MATATAPAPGLQVWFRDATSQLHVDFRHRHFGTGEKLMPENMGAGVAVFDADGDGRLDLYFVQGAPLAASHSEAAPPNPLFRQRQDGGFEEVTAAAGAGDRGYGMGASFGDIDADGDLDLYVTNFGPNALYRNLGDGTFVEVTQEAGLGTPLWSTGAGFFDFDADGDLDLYVANYLKFDFDDHKFCGNAQSGIRSYCHPDVYDGAPDVLYRNDGEGRFTDVSREAGLRRSPDDKGLGVLLADLDGDGHQDIYVANDSTMNYLYLGNGQGRFREEALAAGLGLSGSGTAEASMGVELGDLDGDGRPEIFLTHLDEETNTLYSPLDASLWHDVTEARGLALPSRAWVGFGTCFFDPDLDGDLDVFVTNGHIIDNIHLFHPARRHRQPAQLFENRGSGRFVDVSERLGLEQALVGRGAVAADLDRDGDEDLVVTQNGGPALVLRNGARDERESLVIRLRGSASNPHGFGARLELVVGERRLVRWMKSSTSYLSQGPPEVLFGLGEDDRAEKLTVRWPSGTVDRHGPLVAGAAYTLNEGSESIESLPFER